MLIIDGYFENGAFSQNNPVTVPAITGNNAGQERRGQERRKWQERRKYERRKEKNFDKALERAR